MKGLPADPKRDATLPLNAQLFQTTLGVTSEGFQDALSQAIFGGGMLPPNPQGVDAAYEEEVGGAPRGVGVGGRGRGARGRDMWATGQGGVPRSWDSKALQVHGCAGCVLGDAAACLGPCLCTVTRHCQLPARCAPLCRRTRR